MKQTINTLKVNEKNPRSITTKKMDLLVDSILTFPKMLTIRPIVIDDNCIVLGGNMRTRALTIISEMDIYVISDRLMATNDFDKKSENEKAALIDYWIEWLKHPEVDVVYASELTEEEQKRFVIEDNASFGVWDYDMLSNEWDSVDLENWGVNMSFMGEDDGKTWENLGTVEGDPQEPNLEKGLKIQVIVPEELKNCEMEIKEAIKGAIKIFEGCEIK